MRVGRDRRAGQIRESLGEERVEQLSGQDARFVYAETSSLHMHTLKVAILDVREVESGYSFERFRQELEARLSLMTAFGRRLVPVPYGLAHPFWVEDPEFDVERHIVRTSVAPPGGQAELDAVVGEIAGRALPRDRPLWQISVVEGLADGRVAFVAKIHHSVADGKAAADLLAHVLETEVTQLPAAGGPALQPEQLPSRVDLARAVVAAYARALVRLPSLVVRTVRGLARKAAQRRGSTLRPPRPIIDAPRTGFNRSLTGRRAFRSAIIPLAEMKEIRRAFGVTLNDAFLAIIGSALRAHLARANELPRRPLVAGVPIGAALDDSTRLWGNAVDNMYVTLATDVEDPVERLRRIATVTPISKASRAALGSDVVLEWQTYTPPPLFALAVRGFARTHLANRVPPPINCVVSNVAGPSAPLSIAGARLDEIYSVGPILEGIGLNATVWSYIDMMYVSLLACPDVGPDLDLLVGDVEVAHRELLERARAASVVP